MIKSPHFLDMVQYDRLCDAVEVMHKNNVAMPVMTNHEKPIPTIITAAQKGVDFSFSSEEANRLVLAFQGSGANIKRWKSNFEPDLIKNPEYHDGFADAALLFKEYACSKAEAALVKGKELVVEGYSRGGGIAIFIAMHLYSEFKKYVHLTTFGSPRVLGEAYRDKFNKMNIHYDNVRNHKDPVTYAGAPIFKNLGYIKELPIPAKWNLPWKMIHRHTGYYENIKRLTTV